ncbi:hypothetical protein PCL_12115 [Purpureocillium lilacinum]|uniref:Bacteriophage T5 Orf172 DNA-binding domain-containing protein n=1 Tax=Purpureocillium lilacinum TaxID=33203 RepID=A0A2U3DPF3_PURLI|nr:hypothetical protein PCL_12115 [Purpureocillium lilacinum]
MISAHRFPASQHRLFDVAELWYGEIRTVLGLLDIRSSHAATTTRECDPSTYSTFTKYQVPDGETLVSNLLHIDSEAPSAGSLYIYTHEDKVFQGRLKIGYTGKAIESRLDYWAECGHGYPKLLESFTEVRHPQQVERLVHLELKDFWQAARWCRVHQKPHIEWFEVNLNIAVATIRLWCKWMQDANPYRRSGSLKRTWREHVDFLVKHDNPISVEAMVQINRIELGLDDVSEFVDDNALRKKRENTLKKEEDVEEIHCATAPS